ncbi:MAG: hypothetical protein QY309_04765 [Cyclobacteriaceae bacterium]|nr:MAG: hypothetical protein QY309_04765 [Cyclobacteriaceae bacterium]
MKVEATVKKVTAPAAKFGAGVAGLVIGNMVVSRIPDLTFLARIPVVGNFLSKVAPGVAVMFLALLADKKFKNDLVQSGAFALGLVGFINAVKRLTAGGAEGSFMARVHSALPTGLGGVSQGHAVNSGHYPPTHWTESNAAYDRIPGKVSGLGNAYALEGAGTPGSTAFKLEGFGRLGNAYQLEGRR